MTSDFNAEQSKPMLTGTPGRERRMHENTVALDAEQSNSAVDGLLLRRVSRMTPDGRWVWAWQSDWQFDADGYRGPEDRGERRDPAGTSLMSRDATSEQSDSAEDAARAFASVLRWAIQGYSGTAAQRVRKIADAARSVLADYPGYEEDGRS